MPATNRKPWPCSGPWTTWTVLRRLEDAEDLRAAATVLKEYDGNPAAFATLAEYKGERQTRA